MTRERDAALAAYRVIHPDGPAFSMLSDDERERWTRAYGVAREVNPIVIVSPISLELNEGSFTHARAMLGGTPAHLVTLVYPTGYAGIVHALVEKWKCAAIEVPPESMATRFTWVMVSRDGIFWSKPTD